MMPHKMLQLRSVCVRWSPPWLLWVLLALLLPTSQRFGGPLPSSPFTAAHAAEAATPAATAPPAKPFPPAWCSPQQYARGADMYTDMLRPDVSYKMYHNMYWHNGKWYAVLPPHLANLPAPRADGSGNSSEPALHLEEGLSVNTAAIRLPTTDADAFTRNLKLCYLPGTTLLVDFPFPAFADNNGHWAELMLPTHSVLMDGTWRKALRGKGAAAREAAGGGSGGKEEQEEVVTRVLLPNLRRHMNEWFKTALALALTGSVDPQAPEQQYLPKGIPPVVDMTDLDEFDKLGWLVFENLLVIQDRYTHPQRLTGFIANDHGDLWTKDGCERFVNQSWHIGFSQPRYGSAFRAAAYERMGWPVPSPLKRGQAPSLPKQITLITHHEDYPPIVNNYELQNMLRVLAYEHGMRMRQVSLSTDASFSSHLDTFAQSAVVVGRHGPLLASSIFMAPGSAVVEVLPYKWEWRGISQLYINMTSSLGDLHHFAWRPDHYKWACYRERNDSRYYTWTPEECSARECLTVHARAGVKADVVALEKLMREVLPGVLAGQPVEKLRRPWPQAV